MITAEQLLQEAAELKKKKSEDYQGSTWSEADYFPYKEKSYSHMLHTKYLRMRNIVDGNQKTNFEALDDTLIDMAVYACMFAAYLRNKKGINMDNNTFKVNDKVSKVGGDYKFDGTIVSLFPKLSGVIRIVVEDDRGVLHVYSEKNLKLRD
tara:strand:- start:2656 stop:3108 length:453 start_codon:yes stop_codon:yes gene_type:complete